MLKSSRKPASGGTPTGSVDTLIGVNTELLGDIQFSGGLHIDGTVKGKVSAQGADDAVLSVSETGNIEGDVHVANVVLNGSINGDVYASGKITLNSRARVNGNVHYQVIEMASGATVNGQMMHELTRSSQPASSAAPARAGSGSSTVRPLGAPARRDGDGDGGESDTGSGNAAAGR